MAIPAPAEHATCVVTGASSGIGAELARQLAARGHGVTLVARRRPRLEELAATLREAHGARIEVLSADLTDPEARAGVVDAVTGMGLQIDVLVNNAGFSTVGPVARTQRDRELDMVRTDVEAVVDLCTLVVPGMVERGRGAVLNVASTAAFVPLPGQAGYAASKAFVLSYTHALDAELSGTGVRASALCPGPTRTEFVDATGMDTSLLNGVPSLVWGTSEGVARAGIDGLAAGHTVIVPGALNQLSALSGQVTPRRLLMPVLRRMWPAARA